jgi:hypothetical protein
MCRRREHRHRGLTTTRQSPIRRIVIRVVGIDSRICRIYTDRVRPQNAVKYNTRCVLCVGGTRTRRVASKLRSI